MNSIFILGFLTLLVFGAVLLLWTIKLKLPKWEKVLVFIFLVLTLAGLAICCLPVEQAMAF